MARPTTSSTTPDRSTLGTLVCGYAGAPGELVRSQEPGFAALGLDETALSSPDVAVDVLAGHPELLQCPVLVRSDRVVIGRPTERVAELLD